MIRIADHHQLTLILDVLGTPSLDDFYQINSHRSRDYLRALPFKKKKKFAEMYPKAKPLAIDLMEKCLTFNPKKRITVEEALAHPVCPFPTSVWERRKLIARGYAVLGPVP